MISVDVGEDSNHWQCMGVKGNVTGYVICSQ